MVGWMDCLALANRTSCWVGCFSSLDGLKMQNLVYCVTTWGRGRPHSNKQRVLRDYGIVHQELPSPWYRWKRLNKTRHLVVNSTFAMSTFPFRNGSTTPLAWHSAILKCQPSRPSNAEGNTSNSQLMKSLGIKSTDVPNRRNKKVFV